jgi:colanic acid/amylovoran biosynthesis glycosyltransferase
MKVAYLTNQYPKISHTFIRREIAGVELAGLDVERIAVRASGETFIDAQDEAERVRTRLLLGRGALGLARDVLAVCSRRPARVLRALRTTWALGRLSPRGRLRELAYLAEACTLLRWAYAAGVEHVHVHFASNPVDVALLCRELGGPPFSFTAHGPSDIDSAWARTLPLKVERAAFVVTVCADGRRRLLRWVPPGFEDKVHVVGCGVDGQFFGAGTHGVPDAPRLVCVARHAPEKGLPVLLRAAHKLAGEGRPFELLLIGDGRERPSLEALAASLGLGGRVRFAGWRSGAEIRGAILDSRAMVMSSLSEGLPVVMMEALALHRPVIGTDVGGIAELVVPGQTGWLVPAGSVSQLADAMREVLTLSPAALDELGRRGAQRIAGAHDAADQAGRMAGLLLASRAGSHVGSHAGRAA